MAVTLDATAPEVAAGLRERIGRAAQCASAAWARIERGVVILLVAAIFLLILLNIVTRAAGRPIIWVDELAIYLMVMTCFVGTSLTVRQRLDFAMTLLLDRLGAAARSRANQALTLVGLAYALFILWCCWRLFDPLGLARSGFDAAQFASRTMNFLYTEPTQTLGIPKWPVYLVLPAYGIGLTLHVLANLVEDLGWARPGQQAQDPLTVEAG